MKPITVHVSEPVYRAFQNYARQHDRTAAELIREAMEAYRLKMIQPRTSLRQLPPLSLGKVKRPLAAGDDLLAEMIHDPRT